MEPKFDEKFLNKMQSTTYWTGVFKSNECLEQNIGKQINCKRPSSTKQMN